MAKMESLETPCIVLTTCMHARSWECCLARQAQWLQSLLKGTDPSAVLCRGGNALVGLGLLDSMQGSTCPPNLSCKQAKVPRDNLLAAAGQSL